MKNKLYIRQSTILTKEEEEAIIKKRILEEKSEQLKNEFKNQLSINGKVLSLNVKVNDESINQLQNIFNCIRNGNLKKMSKIERNNGREKNFQSQICQERSKMLKTEDYQYGKNTTVLEGSTVVLGDSKIEKKLNEMEQELKKLTELQSIQNYTRDSLLYKIKCINNDMLIFKERIKFCKNMISIAQNNSANDQIILFEAASKHNVAMESLNSYMQRSNFNQFQMKNEIKIRELCLLQEKKIVADFQNSVANNLVNYDRLQKEYTDTIIKLQNIQSMEKIKRESNKGWVIFFKYLNALDQTYNKLISPHNQKIQEELVTLPEMHRNKSNFSSPEDIPSLTNREEYCQKLKIFFQTNPDNAQFISNYIIDQYQKLNISINSLSHLSISCSQEILKSKSKLKTLEMQLEEMELLDKEINKLKKENESSFYSKNLDFYTGQQLTEPEILKSPASSFSIELNSYKKENQNKSSQIVKKIAFEGTDQLFDIEKTNGKIENLISDVKKHETILLNLFLRFIEILYRQTSIFGKIVDWAGIFQSESCSEILNCAQVIGDFRKGFVKKTFFLHDEKMYEDNLNRSFRNEQSRLTLSPKSVISKKKECNDFNDTALMAAQKYSTNISPYMTLTKKNLLQLLMNHFNDAENNINTNKINDVDPKFEIFFSLYFVDDILKYFTTIQTFESFLRSQSSMDQIIKNIYYLKEAANIQFIAKFDNLFEIFKNFMDNIEKCKVETKNKIEELKLSEPNPRRKVNPRPNQWFYKKWEDAMALYVEEDEKNYKSYRVENQDNQEQIENIANIQKVIHVSAAGQYSELQNIKNAVDNKFDKNKNKSISKELKKSEQSRITTINSASQLQKTSDEEYKHNKYVVVQRLTKKSDVIGLRESSKILNRLNILNKLNDTDKQSINQSELSKASIHISNHINSSKYQRMKTDYSNTFCNTDNFLFKTDTNTSFEKKIDKISKKSKFYAPSSATSASINPKAQNSKHPFSTTQLTINYESFYDGRLLPVKGKNVKGSFQSFRKTTSAGSDHETSLYSFFSPRVISLENELKGLNYQIQATIDNNFNQNESKTSSILIEKYKNQQSSQ